MVLYGIMIGVFVLAMIAVVVKATWNSWDKMDPEEDLDNDDDINSYYQELGGEHGH